MNSPKTGRMGAEDHQEPTQPFCQRDALQPTDAGTQDAQAEPWCILCGLGCKSVVNEGICRLVLYTDTRDSSFIKN